jgi:hypothetical protein
MTQPIGNSFLDDLFKQNRPTDNQGGVSSDFFEVCLKIVFWFIGQIPVLNTLFCDAYARSIDKMPPPDMKKYDSLSVSYPFPDYLMAKQINDIHTQKYRNLIEKMDEAPEYAVCYSRIHVMSENSECLGLLRQKINLFYQGKNSIHMGIPHDENRPALSSNFVHICLTSIPILRPQELYIHGPIEKHDREKLKDLIIRINITILHLDVENDSAVYFTHQALDILYKSRTITTFNLHLMGKKRELQLSNASLIWMLMNDQTGYTINYSNVTPPENFVPKKLTFQ